VMTPDATPLASADERERFYTHLEQVLTELEFLDPVNPKHLMRRLRRLYNRAEPDQTEINVLRGILTSVQRRLSIAATGRPPRENSVRMRGGEGE